MINDEKVYVAFALDCHDRKSISYIGSKEPLLATDIQNLMIETVGKRSLENEINDPFLKGVLGRGNFVETLACHLFDETV
jgi:hypothetical protein